jgi:hypothetical protein
MHVDKLTAKVYFKNQETDARMTRTDWALDLPTGGIG